MNKLYYSISEVSEMLDEEQHILRYWEKEFDQIKPKKNRAGNRIYSDKDIFILKTIKQLLRDDKLSLKGAKEKLLKMNFNQDKNQNEDLFAELTYEKTTKSNEKRTEVSLGKRQLLDLRNLLGEIANFLR